MANKENARKITVQLTPEQMEQIKKAGGKEVAEVELELTPEDLEERIAPVLPGRL
jgi:hypothetical protein